MMATIKWCAFALKHTHQAIVAIVFIVGVLWAFAVPAMEKFVEQTLSPQLNIIAKKQAATDIKQEKYQKEQTKTTYEISKTLAVIKERQRIKDVLDAEMRENIRNLLRLRRRDGN